MDTPTYSKQTRFFTISTAGHVDHGKTSLLRALTGIDPDRLKEEKERQMTTDLGFAYLQPAPDLVIGFVDVPGHGKFLKNMLAGVGGIDMALLVVAADEGPMPQTRQHVRILSLLGVRKAIVAMTKIDMVDDAEHLALVRAEIAALLQQHGIEMLDLVPVSSTRHTGLEELKRRLEAHLRSLPERDTAGGAFLPVDRVFSKSGFGTVVTGTLVRGQLAVGDQVTVGPGVGGARVRRLETHGHTVTAAGPGQRVACNLVLKDNKELARGHVILGHEVPTTRMLVVSLVDLPRLSSESLSSRVSGQPIRLYHGTAEYHGYVRWAVDFNDAPPGAGSNVGAALAPPGTDSNVGAALVPLGSEPAEARAVAFIGLNEPAVAQAQDRFVLRLSDETIYGGEVIVRDRPRHMTRADLTRLAELVLAHDYSAAVLHFITTAPHGIAKFTQLNLFLPQSKADEVSSQLIAQGVLTKLAETLMTADTRLALSSKLNQLVARLIVQQQEAGDTSGTVALESVRNQLAPRLDRSVFQTLIEEEIAAGKLKRQADRLSVAGSKATSSDPQAEKLQHCIAEALAQNLCLEFTELARHCASDVQRVKSALQTMARTGAVHIINYEFAADDAHLNAAHKVLSSIWQQKKNIAPGDFREAMNTNRKYAMALLQHFDDAKITRRLQNGRVLLKAPK